MLIACLQVFTRKINAKNNHFQDKKYEEKVD